MEYFKNMVDSLSVQMGNVLPTLIGALIVLILGFFIAGILRRITKKVLGKTSIDEKIGNSMGSSMRIDDFVAKLVYYLVVIYTLLIVLNLLGIDSVLGPLQGMLDKFMGFLPNVLAAGIIGYVGYLIASIVSEATGFISVKAENFVKSNGMDMGSLSVSKLIKQIVFVIIFIPILILALDALKLSAISEPAKEMLQSFMTAIPKIITAAILLGVFYIIGKYLINILTGILKSLGLDTYANNLGLSKFTQGKSFSDTLGSIGLFFIMFMAVIAAMEKLELHAISDILNTLFEMAGNVFFGVIILGAGVLISNMLVKTIDSVENAWLIPIVRFAIIGLFLAFGLHTMGIAENVVTLAFGLTLGAIAVAFALSFGLGGREAAGKQMEHFFKKVRKEN